MLEPRVDDSATTKQSFADVLDALRNDILFGRLKPRERLTEIELSDRFCAGRHVVRAALDELDRLGLVHRRPNRGAVVCDYSAAEVDELYDVRAILQREAVERMPLPAPTDLVAKLQSINDAYLAQIEAERPDLVVKTNDAFHHTLFSACGNRYLAEAIETYWNKTAAIHCYAIGNPATARASHREHTAMIAALKKGDREKLMRLVIAHMLPALNSYKKAHGGWSRPG